MTAEQLQFVFSLFSFVGVVGILFYILTEKSKIQERNEKIEELEEEVAKLNEYIYNNQKKLEDELKPASSKEKIIALYEQGVDIMQIENMLNVPKATIEMVLKFYNLNKGDNWRESVNNSL